MLGDTMDGFRGSLNTYIGNGMIRHLSGRRWKKTPPPQTIMGHL